MATAKKNNRRAQILQTLASMLESNNGPVSYTHLTLPTILRV